MRAPEKIAVLDFGSQYSHLLVRRIRELGVYAELLPHDAPLEKLAGYRGLVLSGGPAHVYQEGAPKPPEGLFGLGRPVLGVCYGHQLIAALLGGKVARGEVREYGKVPLLHTGRGLFSGLPSPLTVWMSHYDEVKEPPPGFAITASSEGCRVAAMEDGARAIYSLQFHPEVSHTQGGQELLRRFVLEVCGCNPSWSPEQEVEGLIEQVRREVGDGRVLCAVSGGVDSVTTAYIVHRAVGDGLVCLFVDTGLLRKGEAEEVREALERAGIRFIYVNAAERFLARLKGLRTPEQKRRAIGEEFARIFEEEARRLGGLTHLAQGTLYPDVIESAAAGKLASRIKAHHNVGALPKDLSLKLVEPLRSFYKDEVRRIARRLGVPGSIVERHPFPGPGLAVRVIGEVTPEKLEACRLASHIVEEELRRAGLYSSVWQAFAVVGDDLATGVKGDEGELGYMVTVRVVHSEDGMTATWARLPHELLERISRRIVGEVPGVTWVTYAICDKPPSTIEPQ
ncbi:MAG: GMP synthase (glutamine-hydrolyzing) [Nitrososphaerota archaeon]